MNDIIFKKTNKYWDLNKPFFSVITSVHNRRDLILRAMNSVRYQTFNDFEYIVIDNASTEYLDDIIIEFMDSVKFPVMFIKRKTGPGPHTGWNTGYLNARGKYICTIDSDDELVPDAVEKFVNAWNLIPEEEQYKYFDVVAHCKTQYGEDYGTMFPSNINNLPRKEALMAMHKACGEHIHCRRVEVLRKTHFPEPEGVTYVAENTLWDRLHKEYSSYYINERLRIYHIDTNDSLNNSELDTNLFTMQHFVNAMWAKKYRILNNYLYEDSLYRKVRNALKYNICKIILKRENYNLDNDWYKSKINSKLYLLLIALTYIPSVILSYRYKIKR